MSKNVIIAIVVVLLLLVLVFFFMGKNGDQEATNQTDNAAVESDNTNNQVVAQNEDKGVSSFLELVGMGRDMTCTFSTDGMDDREYPTNGTMYSSGGKIRVDSTSVVENEEVTYSMIDDGTNIYTWGSSLDGEFAVKMKHMDMSEQASSPSAPDTAFNYSEQVEYDCDAGNVSNDKFVPPTNVEFMDMEAMMQGSMDMEAMSEMMQQYGNQ